MKDAGRLYKYGFYSPGAKRLYKMEGHHLILGELTDFLTGKTLIDTHDERLRQEISRLLVEAKGYGKHEIQSACELVVRAGGKRAVTPVAFIIEIEEKVRMIIKYGPGSLVTRRRPSLAASRLFKRYQIPVVVVTNGVDAEILDGENGALLFEGLDNIPAREKLIEMTAAASYETIDEKRAEKESGIVFAYEIDGACPCDDTVCRL